MRIRQPIITDAVMVKLPYVNTFKLEGDGSFTTFIYRGNSIFDPVVVGAGGSALGRTEWSGLFDQYQVIGASVHYTILQTNDTPSDNPARVAIGSYLPLQVPATMTEMIENRRSKSRIVMQTQTKPYVMKDYQSTKRALDYFGPLASFNNTKAGFDANPTAQWYHVIAAETMGGGTLDLFVEARITYFCRLTRRDTLPTEV